MKCLPAKQPLIITNSHKPTGIMILIFKLMKIALELAYL